jgi:sugar phosphate permease
MPPCYRSVPRSVQGYFWDMHSFSYFVVVSILAGLFQSTGWPSVVSIVANWSGKGKRGLIMGIWNAHTSVGNILGTVIAAAMLSRVGPCFRGWGLAAGRGNTHGLGGAKW